MTDIAQNPQQPTTFTAELAKLKALIDATKLPDDLKSKSEEMLARLTLSKLLI